MHDDVNGVEAFIRPGDHTLAAVMEAAAKVNGVAARESDEGRIAVAQETAHDLLHLAMDAYGALPAVYLAVRQTAAALRAWGRDLDFIDGRFEYNAEAQTWTWSWDTTEGSEGVHRALNSAARLVCTIFDVLDAHAADPDSAESASLYEAWSGDVLASPNICETIAGCSTLHGLVPLMVQARLTAGVDL